MLQVTCGSFTELNLSELNCFHSSQVGIKILIVWDAKLIERKQ